jgi:pyruvate dehydrogenase E2 component (dihydrolipoamide acetyltransferase)
MGPGLRRDQQQVGGMTGITAITMPKWGLTMTEGKVLGWLKREGDDYRAGEELLEIETSKITNVMEANEAGRLRRIVAQDGASLPIGALLAVAAPAGVPDAEIDAFVAGFVAPAPAADGAAEEAGVAPRDIEAAGKRLRILEMGAGDATPIVLVHGFGGDLNTWMFTQPALAEIRRTVALDLPGHGGSTKEVARGDIAELSAAVEAAMAALGIARAHFVGHSMGGAIVASLVARRPESAASVTLIAAGGLGPDINMQFIDGFLRLARRREAAEVLGLLVHDRRAVSRQMIEDVLRYKRLDGVPAALEKIAGSLFPGGRQRGDLAAAIGAPPMPTQIIWGREDRIIPVAQAEALAASVPVHIIEGAGHLPHMEKAGEVNRLIQNFIAAHP